MIDFDQLKSLAITRFLPLYDKEKVIDFYKTTCKNYNINFNEEFKYGLTGDYIFSIPRIYPNLTDDIINEGAFGEGEIPFGSAILETENRWDDRHWAGEIEKVIFKDLIDIGLYSSQTMECYSSVVYEGSCDLKTAKNKICEIISIILGNCFTDPTSVVYNKVSTKNCVDAIKAKYPDANNLKRTAKFKFGQIMVREFDNSYTVWEYNNCLIYITNEELETSMLEEDE